MLATRVFNKHSPKIKTTTSIILKFFLLISIINSIYSNLWHLLSISIFLLFLLFIPQIIRKSHKIKIPVEFELILLLFVIIILTLQSIGINLTPLFFGIAMSFVGFLIILFLYSEKKVSKDIFFIILFSLTLSVTTGFAVEFMKYNIKSIFGLDIGVNDYIFSMQIMTSVIFGALISSFIGYLYMKQRIPLFTKAIEMFEKSNPKLYLRKKVSKDIVSDLIKQGESQNLEFKSTLRKNLHTGERDKRVEFSVLKAITAFLNSDGGTLLIGVSDKGQITGIEKDDFPSEDKFSLHLHNLIKEKIGKNFMHLISFDILKTNSQSVMKIVCARSDKPVFLKEESEENFYIRSGPASTKISGSHLLDYVERRFI